MRVAAAILAVLSIQSATAWGQQRPAAPPNTWRPAWAEQVPAVPPPGHIGITAHPGDRHPCSVQMYIGNATDTAIREMWGTVLLYSGETSVVARFHTSFIDPQVRRGVPVHSAFPCPRGITRVELREISPCVRGRTHLKGCGAPVIQVVPAFARRTDVIPVDIAPDFDR
ncbi:MAG: hypothetical protein K2X46_11990 [Roseomonas sp.]|nr:hypothetical protein [Roseomonas sp.]